MGDAGRAAGGSGRRRNELLAAAVLSAAAYAGATLAVFWPAGR